MTNSVLDKLTGIKTDLVRGQENWQDWDLPRLAQALKKWRDVNPATEGNNVESMTTPSKRPANKSRFSTQNPWTNAVVFTLMTRVTSRAIARAYPR